MNTDQFIDKFIHQTWWKVITVILVCSTFITGLLFDVPRLAVIHETHTNTLYVHPHVDGILTFRMSFVNNCQTGYIK